MNSSISSGAAMCMYTIRVKNRPLSSALLRKFLEMGSANIGRASSQRDVVSATYWASWSHTIQ